MRGHINRIGNAKTTKAIIDKITEHNPVEVTDAAVAYIHKQTFGVIGHVLDMIEETLTDRRSLNLQSLRAQRTLMPKLDDSI